jgi:hypothetical protein
VGAAIIVFLTLRLGEARLAIAVVTDCTVLFLLLGTNHLVAFISNPGAQFHWPPLILNYIGLVFGAWVLIAFRRRKQ